MGLPFGFRALSKTASLAAMVVACARTEPPEPAPAPLATREKPPMAHTEMHRTETPARLETALLAGGCFWGMEEILRSIPGVLDTEVGYSGGVTRNPTYPQVSSGRTGHAEAVRIVFDPKQLSYETLLERWYFRMHDPTTLNRQGNDRGSNYRSAIFPTSPKQERTAREVIKRVDASGKWKKPVVTSIEPYKGFTAAEANHQDYLQKYPNGYTCHYLRN